MASELVLLMKAIVPIANQVNIAVITVPRHLLDCALQDTSVPKVATGANLLKSCLIHLMTFICVQHITTVLLVVLNPNLVQKALSEMRKAADQKLLVRIVVLGNIVLGLDKVRNLVRLVSFVKMVQKYQIQARRKIRRMTEKPRAVTFAQQVTIVCQTLF